MNMLKEVKIVVIILLYLAINSMVFAQGGDCGLIPEIPDTNLALAIKKQLKIDDFDTLTCVELELLTKLDASRYDISSIEGLQFAVNLGELMLTDNSIEDLNPLEGLTELHFLFLSKNQIVELDPIASLTNIEWLILNDNYIQDISILSPILLPKLKHINVVGNCLNIADKNSKTSNLIKSLVEAGAKVKSIPQNPFDKCSSKD